MREHGTKFLIVTGLLGFVVGSLSSFGCGSGHGGAGTPGTAGRGGAAGTAGGAGATGAAGGTAGAAGGTAGAAGGTAGAAGGTTGAAGGTGGGAGMAGRGGAGGTAGSGGVGGSTCSEPASCEGYDNTPDANLTAAITCLSPSSTPANVSFTLAIFGHHLATGPSDYAIVTIGGGVAMNGIPASACHLDVTVPGSAIGSAGQLPVVVSPGGWIQDSAPATLTVR